MAVDDKSKKEQKKLVDAVTEDIGMMYGALCDISGRGKVPKDFMINGGVKENYEPRGIFAIFIDDNGQVVTIASGAVIPPCGLAEIFRRYLQLTNAKAVRIHKDDLTTGGP